MRFTQYGIIGAVILLGLVFTSLPAQAYSADAAQWFTEGQRLVQSKNYTQAVNAFDQAIALEPTYYEAWDRKADALNREGEFSDALAASSHSLEIKPDYVQGWINRGQILYNIGYYYEDNLHNTEKADEYYIQQIAAFDKAIQLEPDNAEAWFNKGYALAGMKRYDEAIAAFIKVQSLDPDYPNLALSQKQANLLRDAATPLYVRYAVPLLGIILFLSIMAGWFMYRRTIPAGSDDSVIEARKTQRKKE